MYHETDFYKGNAMRNADRTERALTALVIMGMALAGGVGILTLVRGALVPLVQVLGGGQ